MKSKLNRWTVVNHRIFLIPAFILISGCGGQQQTQREGAFLHEDMALGWVDSTVLAQPRFSQFKANYDTVQFDRQIGGLIQQLEGGVDWLVFLGSWCGDSKLHVPRFLKVADAAGIPKERIRLYSLDRSKKSSDGLTEQYRIRLVPTFICLKDGNEIGRITEADMLRIMASAP